MKKIDEIIDEEIPVCCWYRVVEEDVKKIFFSGIFYLIGTLDREIITTFSRESKCFSCCGRDHKCIGYVPYIEEEIRRESYQSNKFEIKRAQNGV